MALLAKTGTGISLTRKGFPSFNAVDLNLEKPSPKGEGWVRGNKDKEKSIPNPPHPDHACETALNSTPLTGTWRAFKRIRRQISEQPAVIKRKLAHVPEPPAAGDLLNRRAAGIGGKQLMADTVEAQS